MEKVIELVDIAKIYNPGENEVEALKGINLTVFSGEFVAIVGHSGCGKSTLMNIIGCLDIPDNGRYLLGGKPVNGMTDRQLSYVRNRQIGFIFQGFNLIPTLTALENVELPLSYRGMPRLERHTAAQRALTMVGLSNRMGHLPSQLSGGQQQRVAIARAIASHPSIILADEPTGNLDSSSGAEVMKILSDLNDSGRTVLLITHDEEVAHKAQRVVSIHDGMIVGDSRK